MKMCIRDSIKAQPGWEFVGIYDDEGISGTSLEHRKGMQQLIEDCKAGKIDLVLTKSIARFARNIVDCLSVIETLKNLDPPVGVKFEADNIYTLDSNGRMILTILASVAEEESHSKSIIMNLSLIHILPDHLRNGIYCFRSQKDYKGLQGLSGIRQRWKTKVCGK